MTVSVYSAEAVSLTLEDAWSRAQRSNAVYQAALAQLRAAEGLVQDTRAPFWNNPQLNTEIGRKGETNPVLRIVRRFIPSTSEYDGQKLFTIEQGKRLATPLFAVLIIVETTDVVFAVDSVPAVLGVSHEQFIVFSSNAFAILGLRSLYFLLGGMQDRFRYLNIGLAPATHGHG